MLEEEVRARLGFGEFDGLGYFKEASRRGILDGCAVGEKPCSEETGFVKIGSGEERLVEEEEEKEDERKRGKRGESHGW